MLDDDLCAVTRYFPVVARSGMFQDKRAVWAVCRVNVCDGRRKVKQQTMAVQRSREQCLFHDDETGPSEIGEFDPARYGQCGSSYLRNAAGQSHGDKRRPSGKNGLDVLHDKQSREVGQVQVATGWRRRDTNCGGGWRFNCQDKEGYGSGGNHRPVYRCSAPWSLVLSDPTEFTTVHLSTKSKWSGSMGVGASLGS